MSTPQPDHLTDLEAPSPDDRRGTWAARVVLGGMLAVLVLVGLAGCESRPLSASHDTPPQSWWEERGPVVPHDSFPRDCSTCHLGPGWESIKQDFSFDHAEETGVPLNGAHARAECLRCHNDRGPVEVFASRGCQGCHEDPHRRLLGVECKSCHGEETWAVKGDIGLHNRTRFPLVGAHAAAACFSCHKGAEVGNFTDSDVTCISCHQSDLAAATNPDHQAQGWVDRCDECHVPTFWADSEFDHQQFPLLGVHATADCESCHVNQQFGGQPTDCAGCHMQEYEATTSPDHLQAGFPTQCEVCHNAFAFEGVSFDHSFFPLVGAHAANECASCHANEVYEGTPTTCVGCHLNEYQATNEPDHAASGFSTTCETCHTSVAWQDADFNHLFFPLTGAHMGVQCAECHEGEVYEGTPTDCASCHIDAYNQTNDPDHAAAGFPTACEQCHAATDWNLAQFDHAWFPLVGSHQAADCASCHENGVFAGTPDDCASCHLDAYNQTNSPDHQLAGFPTSCEVCHTSFTWDGATFDHSQFPLTGAHLAPDCAACHVGGVFEGTSSECSSCHLDEYSQATNPNHALAGFPTECALCHVATAWQAASYDHSHFPLTGAHAAADCSSCHSSGFVGTPSDCFSCHQGDYQSARDPNHVLAGFPTDCTLCHQTQGWSGGTFDHDQFPLEGAHAAADCVQCHVGGVYQGTPDSCVACHLSDYQATTQPNHAQAGFPTTCETCHEPFTWTSAAFDHSQFPLTGSHAAVDCESCHVGGVYEGTPTSCAGCHMDDYQATTDPDHAQAGFPTTCETCHTPSTWTNGSFDHSWWPLTGQHQAADCASCHAGGQFQGTPTACISCHQGDYDSTNDPNHAAAGFPTNCQVCHTTNGWGGASFDHDFPLSGPHDVDCMQCHTNPGNYQAFSCLDCHAHNKTKMDSEHQGENGYSYNSSACYHCHPNGNS